jgi:hypothetical protein
VADLAHSQQAHEGTVLFVLVVDADYARHHARHNDLRESESKTEEAKEIGEALTAGAAILVCEALIRRRSRGGRTSSSAKRRSNGPLVGVSGVGSRFD